MRICKLAVIFFLMTCTAVVVSGQTLSPNKVFGRYQQYVWQDQHGLPQNGVSAITRTRDGYLWVGTFEGAARFDGVRFTVFDTNNVPELKSGQILNFLEDSHGDLWMGTNGGGLIRRSGDTFKVYTTKDGLSSNFVYSLTEDTNGNLWIGTEGAGLNRLRDGRIDVFTTKDGLPDDYVRVLVSDRTGGVWVGTNQGLALVKDGRITLYAENVGLPKHFIAALCVDHKGQLWVGTRGFGLLHLVDGKFVDSGLASAQKSVSALYEDRDGNLWIGSEAGGLGLLSDGKFSYYSLADGLPSDFVRYIYQDPEGDIWVGTVDAGVCQLRAGRFGVLTTQDGLPHNFVMAVFEDSRGTLWIGTQGGLATLKVGVVNSYTPDNGLPGDRITAIGEDSSGTIWIGARGQLCRLRNNRWEVLPLENGQSFNQRVQTVLGDRAGNLWIGTRGSGLNLYRDGRFTLYTTKDGLADNDIMSLYEDREGGIWIGGLKGGISRFKDGHFTTWTEKDGLASNPVVSFYEDRKGSMWIGAHEAGLIRFRDGKFSTVKVKDGLFDNLAFQILSDTPDDSGDLWMSCNKGIHRANLKELNDFLDGRKNSINSYSYGVADGMLSRECNGASPGGWKTRDGRLWFPTVKGVVVIRPGQRDMRRPLVAIEQAVVDRTPFSTSVPVRISPGQSSLEIRYTALSWNRPQQVRFKYQMVGLDENWIDADTRRTAYFSHLPPGSYTFKVIADNGEGIWNLEGQSLSIVVLPPFYRTWWFMILVALGLIALVLVAWKNRVGQLERAQIAQQNFSRQLIESQELERKRIAAELHDSLGQTLLVIKNRAFLGARAADNADSPDPRLEVATEQLGEISDSASEAINQVREISYHLRPSQLERLGLTASIQEMLEQVESSSGIEFETEVAQLDGVFSKDSEINFYRIAQESLNNVIKHSEATTVKFTIARDRRGVELTIHDNGKGFNPNVRTNSGKSGFGLTGMAERTRILGGKYSIDSEMGRGTTVIVKIDAPQTN